MCSWKWFGVGVLVGCVERIGGLIPSGSADSMALADALPAIVIESSGMVKTLTDTVLVFPCDVFLSQTWLCPLIVPALAVAREYKY